VAKEQFLQHRVSKQYHAGAYDQFIRQSEPKLTPLPRSESTPLAPTDDRVNSQLPMQLFGLREMDEKAASPPYVRRRYTSAAEFREDRLWRQVYGDHNTKQKFGKPLTSAQEIGWDTAHRGSTPPVRRLVTPAFSFPGPALLVPRTADRPKAHYPLSASEITNWDTHMCAKDLWSYRGRKRLGKPNQEPLMFRENKKHPFKQM